MFEFLIRLFGNPTRSIADTIQTRKPQPSPMNEGDVHSGPHGYSANTAYTETQYGSRFDEESEWNEEP